jgi:3-oxoacyl-[acyl-carrier-protein] synthase-1
MKEVPFSPQQEVKKNVNVKHVISNSFGFGGNCSAVVFSKAPNIV